MNALLATLAALATASGSSTLHTPLGATPPAGPDDTCALLLPGSARARVADCLRCHDRSGPAHPVGLVYGRVAHRAGLRTEAQVIRAGVFLPDGEIRCTTCHDGRSKVRFRIALPPGAAVRPGVVVGDPSTYEERPPVSEASMEGQVVGAKPICLACHAL